MMGMVPRSENVEQRVFTVHQQLFISGAKHRISMEYGVIDIANPEYHGPEAGKCRTGGVQCTTRILFQEYLNVMLYYIEPVGLL